MLVKTFVVTVRLINIHSTSNVKNSIFIFDPKKIISNIAAVFDCQVKLPPAITKLMRQNDYYICNFEFDPLAEILKPRKWRRLLL